MKRIIAYIMFFLSVLAAVWSCATQTKLNKMQRERTQATIQLAQNRTYTPEVKGVAARRDTITVKDEDGTELIIMKAVRDESTGDMVANEQLDAAVVTARFRNLAERHGKVDLEFQIIVPQEMQDERWQLRFHPDMFILGDSTRLDDVVITGADYRKLQLKGYQQYQKFLNKILSDKTRIVDMRNLEIWLSRNIPEIYAMKYDSTEVSDEQFYSFFGTSEQEAVEHYTRGWRKRSVEQRWADREKMWHKYIKDPILSDGVRLDTVMMTPDGDFIYNYVQTINTRKGLRKVDIVLSGDVFEQGRRLYDMPPSDPLTFYISSVAAFVDRTEKYMNKTIYRRVTANATADITFKEGKWDIDENLANNRREIRYIKDNLRTFIESDEFVLDSVKIASFASPEGTLFNNNYLCEMRARSASSYFDRFVRGVKDSVRRAEGLVIAFDENMNGGQMRESDRGNVEIKFRARSGGENWKLLDELVRKDTVLTDAQKEEYFAGKDDANLDARERALFGKPFYRRLRDGLYPGLRLVNFDFAMHRRNMVEESVTTTVLDTLYASGVRAIEDRDFDKAIEILRPYNDYNTAIAYVAMDHNESAMAILRDLPKTDQVNYMLAILYARAGDDQNAVQHYMDACRADRMYVSRGNLDPEISALIKKYNLNAEPEDDWGDLGF